MARIEGGLQSAGDTAALQAVRDRFLGRKNSVVASAGAGTTVSGAVGLWISIAEFSDGKCVGFATGCIGVDGLLPDVWYQAKGGKLVKLD